MANDRIYLMCKGCATHITLYKYLCTEDSSYCPAGVNEDELGDFMTHHIFECQGKWGADLQDDPGFILVTEGKDYQEAANKYQKVEVDVKRRSGNGNKG